MKKNCLHQKIIIIIAMVLGILWIHPSYTYAKNQIVSYGLTHMEKKDLETLDYYETMTEHEIASMKREDEISTFSYGSETTDETGLFGSNLTGTALEMYELLDTQTFTRVDNTFRISFRRNYEDGNDGKYYYNLYKESYFTALLAYYRDHMDQFIWATNAYTFGYRYEADKILIVLIYNISPYATDERVSDVKKQVETLTNACNASGREDKLRYYHDWLVTNNQYDDRSQALSETYKTTEIFYFAHSPMGCMIGGKGVCESYAKSLKLFCMAENIPCLIVSSDTHAWNYVKMEDGEWYLVDCTWDDPSGANVLRYTYFLVSNEPNMDSSHTIDTDFIYPTTSTSDYELSHNYRSTSFSMADCSNNGNVALVCNDADCGKTKTEVYPNNPHYHAQYSKKQKIIPANCVEEGADQIVCSGCEAVFESTPIEIDEDAHKGGTVLKKAMSETCAKDGYTGDIHCQHCDAILTEGEVIPANGKHVSNGGVVTKEANCVEEGLKQYHCVTCGGHLKDEVLLIDANNHKEGTVTENDVKETCNDDGYSGDIYCEHCEVLLIEGHVIPATGNHISNGGVVTKEANCVEVGLKVYHCVTCGSHLKDEILSKNPNKHVNGTVIINNYTADYGHDGYTGDEYCSSCNQIVRRGNVVEKPVLSTKLTSVKNLKGKKMKVVWMIDGGANGYQVQYSINKNFKKGSKTITIAKNIATKTISKLKKSKTYFIRVRCYTDTTEGRVFSDWSNVKKIKIKK